VRGLTSPALLCCPSVAKRRCARRSHYTTGTSITEVPLTLLLAKNIFLKLKYKQVSCFRYIESALPHLYCQKFLISYF